MITLTARAQNAYAPASPATHTPRDAEYHAFAHVTGLLSVARDTPRDAIGYTARLAEALHENVRLWMALGADVASDENQLPKPLRVQILGLANFARTHMLRVLAGEETVDPLIDVNMAIMKGLRGTEEEQRP
jgi:flagellar protein FlaF